MRYYVEQQTVRQDGVEVWHRVRVADHASACEAALQVVLDMFAETDDDRHNFSQIDFGAVFAPWFRNDLGDDVCVRAVGYGEAAQVREGSFTI